MIGKIKSIAKTYKNINLFKTLVFRKKLQNSNVFLYRNLHFYLAKDSNIDIRGKLEVGCQWKHGRYYPSQFVIHRNSNLEVKSDFKIFTKCNIWLNENATLILGSGYINNGLNMTCFNKIEIGNNVAIAENVTIRDSDDHYINSNSKKLKSIKIGNNVWVGMNATILKGVTIGDGAIVAAGSVVNRDVLPNTMVAGIPARVKKTNIQWSL